MKAYFLLVSLFCLPGCGTIQQMNSNMQRSNELMAENIVVMTDSRGAIEENTEQVTRSTDTMEDFAKVIASNTAAVNKVMDQVETHSYFLPTAFIAILILLFLPSVILIIFYRRIVRSMKSFKK